MQRSSSQSIYIYIRASSSLRSDSARILTERRSFQPENCVRPKQSAQRDDNKANLELERQHFSLYINYARPRENDYLRTAPRALSLLASAETKVMRLYEYTRECECPCVHIYTDAQTLKRSLYYNQHVRKDPQSVLLRIYLPYSHY